MDAQDKIKVVCECGYSTPPPECCNGSTNVWQQRDWIEEFEDKVDKEVKNVV